MTLLAPLRAGWRIPLVLASTLAAAAGVAFALRRPGAPAEPTLEAFADEIYEAVHTRTGFDLRAFASVGEGFWPTVPEAALAEIAALEALRRVIEAKRDERNRWVHARLAATDLPGVERFRWLLEVEPMIRPAKRQIALYIADYKLLQKRLELRPGALLEVSVRAAAARTEVAELALRALVAMRDALVEHPTSVPHGALDSWLERVEGAAEAEARDALRAEGEHMRALFHWYEIEAHEQPVRDAYLACVRTLDERLPALEPERRGTASSWW